MVQFWNQKDKAKVNKFIDQHIPLVDTYFEFLVLYIVIPTTVTYILLNYGIEKLFNELILTLFGAFVTVLIISKVKKTLSGIGIGGTPETRGKPLKSNW